MGLLDLLLGKSNPIASWADSNQNTLGAIGAGLARGPDFSTGLANAAQLVPQARPLDQAFQQSEQSRNATYQMLKRDPNFAWLADAVANGTMSSADAYSFYAKSKVDAQQKQQALSQGQTFAKSLAAGPNAGDYSDIIDGLNNGGLTTSDAFKVINQRRTQAGKPPTVTSMFNDKGDEQKVTWDAASGSWKPFGGPKAPAGDPNQDDNVQAIGDAIIQGQQAPDLTQLYHLAGPLKAYLANKSYPLANAQLDWKTTQRLLQTMAGPQQTRIRQATQQVSDQLGLVRGLADQWKAGGFSPLNAAVRKAAETGALGQKAQSLVTRLDSAIADMTGELANVYMGGNSPTDKAIDLAGRNLNADWADTTLDDNIDQIGKNLQIRLNSLNLATPGFPDSTYNPMTPNGGGYAPTATSQYGYGQGANTTSTGVQWSVSP